MKLQYFLFFFFFYASRRRHTIFDCDWFRRVLFRSYPGETAYRHSLAEEAEALRLVVESVQTQMKEKRVKNLSPSLDNLVKLNDDGMLEPFILFARDRKSVV